jgi:surfactin synthase thioesterase subunit
VSDVAGTNPDFLANEDFAAAILPTLRSLRAIAGYTCAPWTRVSCRIHAFLGDNDPLATYGQIQQWGKHTISEFTIRVFPGDHFYVISNLPALVQNVEADISRCRDKRLSAARSLRLGARVVRARTRAGRSCTETPGRFLKTKFDQALIIS